MACSREVDHRSGCCLIAEGAICQLSGCGGAEIVDRYREAEGGGKAGRIVFRGQVRIEGVDGESEAAGDGRGIGAIGGRELEAGEVGALELADRGGDGIAVAAGRIIKVEGQGAGDHQGFCFVGADGEADGSGSRQGPVAGSAGVNAQGATAEIEVLDGVADHARDLINSGGPSDGALARIFLALDLIRSLACGLGGAVLAEGKGATPVLQLGAVAGGGADAVGGRSR